MLETHNIAFRITKAVKYSCLWEKRLFLCSNLDAEEKNKM